MNLKNLEKLKINIFLDGADLNAVKEFEDNNVIKGYTSNPSLMVQNNIKDYDNFIEKFVKLTNKPISFEVISDTLDEMFDDAKKIKKYGENISVKIPVTTTSGESTIPLISKLTEQNIKINVTALFTLEQTRKIIENVVPKSEIILSIFAGRIADTGVNPEQMFLDCKNILSKTKNEKKNNFKLLWASVREFYNVIQAERIGADIVTVPQSILKKSKFYNYDLNNFSIDTIQTFYNDALNHKLKLNKL